MELQNPIALWSDARIVATTCLFAVAVLISGALIHVSDGPLLDSGLPRSAALEWVFRPSKAASIVGDYETNNAIAHALRGLALDTFAFIPSYVGLLFMATLCVSRTVSVPWANVGLALAWGTVVAGALDLIENAGTMVELVLHWSFAAPFTGAVCGLKWLSIAASVLFTTLGLLILRSGRG